MVDAIDTVVGGFGGGLGLVDSALLVLLSAAAIGLWGAVVGLFVAIIVITAGSLGVRLHGDHSLRVRGRVVLTRSSARGVTTAGVTAAVFIAYVLYWHVLASGAVLERTTAAALVSCTLAAAAALGWLLSCRRCPRWVVVGLWAASIAGVYFLETRLIYAFSRLGRVTGLAHAVFLALLVGLLGCALWLTSTRLRSSICARPRASLLGVAAAAVIAFGSILAVESFGSHRVRLVFHERQSLPFRVLDQLPSFGAHRAARQRARWRASCSAASPALERREVSSGSPIDVDAELKGVVVVLIDTLRSDKLELRRDGHPLMPNTLALAEEAQLLPNTYTTSPGTTKAIASLMTSRFPDEVDRPAIEEWSIASRLARSDIKSVLVSAHSNLESASGGFDVYDDLAAVHRFTTPKKALTSELTVRRAIAQLRALETSRFFMVVHFFDPHAHYVPNPRFDFGAGEENRYDAEIKYTDYWLGVLLSKVLSGSDTGVIITSDHGDEFWEHRYKRHQLRLYDETTRIPLLIFDPRVRNGFTNRSEASLLDVAPTALDLLDVPVDTSMRGRSLADSAARLRDGRPVFSYSTNQQKRAVVGERRKLIFDSQTGILEYYDLSQDPGEAFNRADVPTAEMHELACELEAWMQSQGI
jgi:hypothetical protein